MSNIKKNLFYNSLYQILLIITPLITSPYISRKLGATEIGRYGYTYTISNYFLIFAMLGVKNYGNRSIAKVRDDREKLSETFWSIYILQLFLIVVSLGIYVVYLRFICKENNTLAFIQILLLFSGMFDISWFFFGMELFKLSTTRNIIVRILTVILIFIFVKNPSDIWKYTIIMTGGILVSQLIIWPFLNIYIDWKKITFFGVISHLKPNVILFIPVIAVSMYKMLDKIMIGNISNMAEVGYYENAEKIINIPMGLITALGTVMLPRMSNLVAKGSVDKVKSINEKSMLFAMFMSNAMSFGIISISNSFVPLFFGEKFIQVIPILKYLAPSMIFICWANVIRTQYLLPNSKDTSYIISVILGAVINIIINIIFIPKIGAVGAAIGTLVAEGTVCIVQTIMVWNEMECWKYIKNSIPFTIFGIIMYVSINYISVKGYIVTIILQILVGAIIYVLLSSIYFTLYNRDIKSNLYNFLNKRKSN